MNINFVTVRNGLLVLFLLAVNISASANTAINVLDEEGAGFFNEPTSFIAAPGTGGMQWRYEFISGSLPSNWQTANFNDSDWGQSAGGFYTYADPSAAWVFESAEGNYVYIRSAWQPNVYLHTQGKDVLGNTVSRTSQVTAGPIETYWWSAQWELVPDGDRFLIRNRWLDSGEFIYLYDEGNVYADVLDENLESRFWTITDTLFSGPDVPSNTKYIGAYWQGQFLSAVHGKATSEALEQSVGGNSRINMLADEQNTPWDRSKTQLVARSEFQLSAGQQDTIMFWGRWDREITIFVNGSLAVEHAQPAEGYRYLGLSHEARQGLFTDGSPNTIAVHVKANNQDSSRYFDLGIVNQSKLAQLEESGSAVSSELEAISDEVKQQFSEQGAAAVTFAIVYDGDVVLTKGYGYEDKSFNTTLSSDAIMRLASNDKQVTRAAMYKMIADGVQFDNNPVTTDTKVFDAFSVLGVSPFVSSPDSDFAQIDVSDLIYHESGVLNLPNDAPLRDLPESSRTNFYNYIQEPFGSSVLGESVSWIWSQPVNDHGTYRYNSAGSMVLRYFMHRIQTGGLEGYLQTGLGNVIGNSDVVIAHENPVLRDSSEPWYATHKMSYERWIYLDDYLAVASSAPYLALMLDKFNTWPQHSGAMAGTWSFSRSTTSNITGKKITWVMITNEYAIDFDAIFFSVEDDLRNLTASSWSSGSGSGAGFPCTSANSTAVSSGQAVSQGDCLKYYKSGGQLRLGTWNATGSPLYTVQNCSSQLIDDVQQSTGWIGVNTGGNNCEHLVYVKQASNSFHLQFGSW